MRQLTRICLFLSLVFGLCAVPWVSASGSDEPEVFECTLHQYRDVEAGQDGSIRKPAEITEMPACLLAPKAIASARIKHEWTTVDVRSSQRFAEYRVDPSVNIPLHRVSQARFLRGKNILLIGERRELPSLLQLCQALESERREAVKVFDGSIADWPFAGGIVGNPPRGAAARIIDIDEFVAMQRTLPMYVVGVAKSNSAYLERVSDSVMQIGELEKDKHALGSMPAWRSIPEKVVFIGEDEVMDELRRIHAGLDERNVFILRGGLAAHQKFMNDHKAMNHQARRKSSQPLSCAGRS